MIEGVSDTVTNSAPNGWDESVREHTHELRGWTRRLLGGDEGLDDVMQEVALATFKSANRPTDDGKVLPWMKGIARHKVQDYWRKVGRERRLHDEVAAAQPDSSSAEWVLGIDRLDAVRDALNSLEPAERQLLVAKYTDGQSYEEMASASGISVKALEYRLGKARENVRARLNQMLDQKE